MAVELGVGYVSIVPEASGLQAALARELSGPLDRIARESGQSASRHFGDAFTAGLSRAGSSISQIGGLLTVGLTAPLVGLGGLALKTSIDFESAFAGVRKTVDATEAQLAVLRQGIIDMSKDLPASAGEIAAVAEAAGQLGIRTEDILGFTQVMVDLGETTNLTADQAANALARMANIIQLPAEEFDNLGSAIVDLGNKGAATESEIVEMALRIAGAGKTVGLTAADILGVSEALSSLGIEAEAGGSSFSRVLLEIEGAARAGGEGLQVFADTAGLSAQEFTEAWDQNPALAIASVVEGLGRLQQEGGDVFQRLSDLGLGGEIRVRDMMLRLAGSGDQLRTSLGTAAQAWQDNNALQIEASKRYETTGAKIEVLKNRVVDLGRRIGDALVPVSMGLVEQADPLIGKVDGLITKFTELDPHTQRAILGFLTAAAAAGPFLVVVGKLALGLSSVVSVLSLLATPVGLVVAGLAALAVGFGVAWVKAEGFDAVLSTLRATWDRLVAAFREGGWRGLLSELGDVLAELGPKLRDGISSAFNTFKDDVWPKVLPALEDIVRGIGEWVKANGPGILRAVRDGLFAWAKFIYTDVYPDLFRSLGSLLLSLGKWILFDAVPAIAGWLWQWGKQFGLWVRDTAWPWLSAELPILLANLATWIVTVGVPTLLSSLAEWGRAFVNWVVPRIPELVAQLAGLVAAVAEWILSSAPLLVETLFRWGLAFVSWLLPRLPTILLHLGIFFAAIAAATVAVIPTLVAVTVAMGVAMVVGVVRGLFDQLPQVLSWFGSLPGRILAVVAGAALWLVGTGGNIIVGLVNGIVGRIGHLAGTVAGLAGHVIGAIGDAGSWLYNAGTQVVSGLANGIRDTAGRAASAAANMARDAKNAALSVFDILSPSRVFEDIGHQVVAGFVVGVKKAEPMVNRSMTGFGALVRSADLGVVPVGFGASLEPAAAAASGGGNITQIFHKEISPKGAMEELAWTMRTGR